MMSSNISEQEKDIRTSAEKIGTRAAIISFLEGIAEELPEHQFPNGYTVEQTADVIIKVSEIYTNIRDTNPDLEGLRKIIAQNCTGMSTEEAISYLAILHTAYNKMDGTFYENSSIVSMEELRLEYEKRRAMGNESSGEEQVEELIDSIEPVRFANSYEFAGDEEYMNAISAENSEDALPAVDKERYSIMAAVLYGEAVKENTADKASMIDPGMLTAQCAACMDTAQVAAEEYTGNITYEKAEIRLNIIERALAAALAAALAMVLLAVGGEILSRTEVYLGKIGWFISSTAGIQEICFELYTQCINEAYGTLRIGAESLLLIFKRQIRKVAGKAKTGISGAVNRVGNEKRNSTVLQV